jgi:hypothetical protein
MCTMIANRLALHGTIKAGGTWTTITEAFVGYDHPIELDVEHAVTLDLVDERDGAIRRIALELPLEEARRLHCELARVIDAADSHEGRTGL